MSAARRRSIALRDPAWLRYTLLAIALAFVALFLVLPLIAVFGYALAEGVEKFVAATTDDDAKSAMKLTLLVGNYAQSWHLGAAAKSNMTETVKAWRDYAPRCIPLPHPSWRNNGWLKQNPWFERELVPYLRLRVRRVLSS